MRLTKHFTHCALLFIQAVALFYVVSVGSIVFASPDETAVAVSARLFARTGTMRIEDPVVAQIPFSRSAFSFESTTSSREPREAILIHASARSDWLSLGATSLALTTSLAACMIHHLSQALWKALFSAYDRVARPVSLLLTFLADRFRGHCFATRAFYRMPVSQLSFLTGGFSSPDLPKQLVHRAHLPCRHLSWLY